MKTSKTIAKVTSFATTAYTGLFLASASFADSADSYLGRINTGVNEDLETMMFRIINWAIGIAAVLSVVILIASGYMYITAAGDEGKIEKATKTLTWAIVGLVVCFISVILVEFVLKKIILKQ